MGDKKEGIIAGTDWMEHREWIKQKEGNLGLDAGQELLLEGVRIRQSWGCPGQGWTGFGGQGQGR